MLKLALPGMASGGQDRLNIARIYDQEYNNKLDKIYHKVDFENAQNVEDEINDNLGYLGLAKWYREKQGVLVPISETDFVKTISSN